MPPLSHFGFALLVICFFGVESPLSVIGRKKLKNRLSNALLFYVCDVFNNRFMLQT
jgi:hypothetical protein